jgi:hypothetical protein
VSFVGQSYYHVCTTAAGQKAAQRLWQALRTAGLCRQFRLPVDCLGLGTEAVRALMHLWRRIHWSSGDGMMPPAELLAVYRLAVECPAQGDFVELGAWKGLTTCYLATACRVRGCGQVVAVDTFQGTREHDTRYAGVKRYGGETLSAFRRTVRQAGVVNLVRECVSLTTPAAIGYPGGPIAFLLIDADHSYGGVKGDFEAWFPLVAPGGTVVFHDYAMTDAEVRDFVDGEVVGRDDVLVLPGNVVPNVFAVTKSANGVVGTRPVIQPPVCAASLEVVHG